MLKIIAKLIEQSLETESSASVLADRDVVVFTVSGKK